MTKTILDKIYRFPIKGFPSQQLEQTALRISEGIPHDRRFAVTKGTKDTGEFMRAASFYINATTDGMSRFCLEGDSETILLRNVEGMELSLDLKAANVADAANKVICEFMRPVGIAADLPAPVLIDRIGNQPNWDYADTPISFINLATVTAISDAIGIELNPLRFRGNLLFSGLPAWEEFAWMGKRLKIGTAELEIHRPIDRCPTPGVNPTTGERDVEVTPGIQEHFGHIHCGMYAKVVKNGSVSEGDPIEVIGDADMPWTEAATDHAREYQRWPRLTEVASCSVDEDVTRIALKSATPWPLPPAQKGQRLRLHLGTTQWTTQYVSSMADQSYRLEVEDSVTGDPITNMLRNETKAGNRILVSGPFGKATP